MAAGKVEVTINLRWVRNNSSLQGQAKESSVQVGEAAIENVQFIGLTSEPVDFGDVTDPGWVLLKNFDTTTEEEPVADIYLGTTDPVTPENAQIKLTNGKSAYLAPAPNTSSQWFAVAGAADTKLLVIAIQR